MNQRVKDQYPQQVKVQHPQQVKAWCPQRVQDQYLQRVKEQASSASQSLESSASDSLEFAANLIPIHPMSLSIMSKFNSRHKLLDKLTNLCNQAPGEWSEFLQKNKYVSQITVTNET